jgi:hypothetical protein
VSEDLIPQDRCCDDVAMHCHDGETYKDGRRYVYTFTFEPRRPQAHIYRAAVRRRFHVGLNRYPGVVIGIAFQVGSRVLSLTWGSPGKVVER